MLSVLEMHMLKVGGKSCGLAEFKDTPQAGSSLSPPQFTLNISCCWLALDDRFNSKYDFAILFPSVFGLLVCVSSSWWFRRGPGHSAATSAEAY